MKNALIALVALLLMSKLSYCQETYPKTLLIGNDTVVVLLHKQVTKINLMWDHKRFLESENEILNKTLNKYTILSSKKDTIINQMSKTISEIDLEVSKQNKITNDLRQENKELNIHLTKAKKSRKIWFLVGAGVGILTTALIN